MESKNYSVIYRLMHWLIAISFILLLITIFLRMTWLNKNHVADIIKDYLASNTDVKLSDDQLISLAKKIRKPMWDWHIYIGYFLVGLYSIRFILPFFGEMKFSNPFSKGLSSKVKFQFWVYLIFYVFVATSLITGLFIEFGPDSLVEPIEEIHVLSIYYLLSFIVIHITGVLVAEFTDKKGLISSVVSGPKK